jgi:hypothetical protein
MESFLEAKTVAGKTDAPDYPSDCHENVRILLSPLPARRHGTASLFRNMSAVMRLTCIRAEPA